MAIQFFQGLSRGLKHRHRLSLCFSLSLSWKLLCVSSFSIIFILISVHCLDTSKIGLTFLSTTGGSSLFNSLWCHHLPSVFVLHKITDERLTLSLGLYGIGIAYSHVAQSCTLPFPLEAYTCLTCHLHFFLSNLWTEIPSLLESPNCVIDHLLRPCWVPEVIEDLEKPKKILRRLMGLDFLSRPLSSLLTKMWQLVLPN